MGLKPCPFCGGESLMLSSGSAVICNNKGCGARISALGMLDGLDMDEKKSTLVNLWNKRHDPDQT